MPFFRAASLGGPPDFGGSIWPSAVDDSAASELFFVVDEVDFFVVSFLVVPVEDFLVVEVLAGDFSGAVVVDVSVLFVLHPQMHAVRSATAIKRSIFMGRSSGS